MTVVIREVEMGGKLAFRFDAYCDAYVCGTITVVRTPKPVGGRVSWNVRSIYVDGDRRRQRIGTRLYEAAAREACRRRGQLVSVAGNRDPGAHSHDFWAKQARRGVATVTRTGSYALPCPVTELARPRRL
jgi:GNAT superfamily N-acetyltransferase